MTNTSNSELLVRVPRYHPQNGLRHWLQAVEGFSWVELHQLYSNLNALDIDDGPNKMGRNRIILSDLADVFPKLPALRNAPTVLALIDRDNKSLGTLQEFID